MATRFAIANGNWSNAAIWDNGAVPVAGDDVYANGFTVTLDVNATVNTLRNDTSGANNTTSPNVLVPNIATPVMTSNTTPTGSVTASTGGNPYLAFDQSTVSSVSFWATTALNSGWLAYQFPSAKTIRRYAFINFDVNRMPRTWTFEGSNDGITWAVLDTQTNLTLAANVWYNYPIASPASYTWYRINVTAVNTTGNPVRLDELQMTESSGVVLGNTVNGTFNLNGGVTLTCTNAGAAGGIINANSGVNTVAFTTGTSVINSRIDSSGTGATVSLNSTGTLTINGNITAPSQASRPVIRVNAAATLNLNGNIVGSGDSVGQCIASSGGGGSVLNVVGNITGGGSVAINAFFLTINITGNLFAGGGAQAVTVSNGQTVTITGNLTASGGSQALACTGSSNITINGDLTASANNPALNNTSTAATIVVSGNLINNVNGTMAVYSPRLQISPAANQSWYMTTSGGADRTLYTTGLLPPAGGYPAVGDVRSGVTYGAGLYTGTCIIPAANTVALGVPVDTTTGTAVLPISVATQMWAEPVTNLTVAGSIGERLKNCATVDTTGYQIAALM